ncbi:MAG: heparinase II/III family protein [Streptosporangiaceae bacterium]
MTGSDLALLARTAVHLRPSQIAQRARLRAQRQALRHIPAAGRWLLAGPDPASAAGWPAGFVPLDAPLWRNWPGLAGLRQGRLELLGMTRTLARSVDGGRETSGAGDPAGGDRTHAHRARTDWEQTDWAQADWAQADWAQAGAPALWRYHLYYWDWAWGLIAQPLRADARAWFAALWRSWTSAVTPGQGDAWHPYPAALRAWSFCGIYRDLVAGSGTEDRFIASLSAHAGFLRRHLETDAGGNHLVKNLKALAGLAVFFADEELLDQTLDRLIGQLAVQVLPDGGHFERAPAYHCQVLGDLIDVDALIRVAGLAPGPELAEVIEQMRRWLGCVLSPDGQVPMLNDGYPVDPALIGLLQPGAAPDDRLLVLPDTGLVRASAGGWRLLADAGPPCPDELPAHAHADTFSCLVHVDGAPLLVDTGTSTYAPGPMRDYERSSAAHNTVEIDGANSTEVWGAFRAARRARVGQVMTRDDGGELTAGAAHDGFRRLPGRPVHRRRWTLSGTGLRVDDLVSGTGVHSVTVRWHLAPGSAVRLDAGQAAASTPAGDFQLAVSASHPVALRASTAPVATGFGRAADAPVLVCRVSAALPVRITTVWRRAGNIEQMPSGEPASALEGAL